MHNRPYDIIVFGATGFTGKLVVEYLIEHYGVNNKLFTWAIACLLYTSDAADDA